MPEQRARTYHRNRVANTFSDEIGAMLEGELSDPRIAPSYVTDVVLAPGGKSARVFVAVHGWRRGGSFYAGRPDVRARIHPLHPA